MPYQLNHLRLQVPLAGVAIRILFCKEILDRGSSGLIYVG